MPNKNQCVYQLALLVSACVCIFIAAVLTCPTVNLTQLTELSVKTV